MPSTKLANTGGAKIGGGCGKERELSFIQVRPHFLWNISELSIRLLIFFFLLLSCLYLLLYESLIRYMNSVIAS